MRFFRRLFSRPVEPRKGENACGDHRLEVEYLAPIATDCDCCDGVTITLNRLVKRDGWPYAMCRITYSEVHLNLRAKGSFGIGMFGQGTSPEQRVAFAVLLRHDGAILVDATEAEWPDTDILGPKLSREAALQHERKGDLFRLIDELYSHNSALASHFAKVIDGTGSA